MTHGLFEDAGLRTREMGPEIGELLFTWLDGGNFDRATGTYTVVPDHVHAIVMEYSTTPRDTARFESHREFVDFQYTIEGDEMIDWCPTRDLSPDGPFDNDVQFWKPPAAGWSSLQQSQGRFAIFYPEDAHRSGIASISKTIRKVVFKIRLQMLVHQKIIQPQVASTTN